MLRFKNFITNVDILLEAKIDDFTNRYFNYHKEHPTVTSSPEEAKKLISHAHQFAQGHDESIFLTKQLLDRAYNPGEDDETIKTTLGKWRKAKTQGLVGGKLSDHSHESISAVFRDIPQLNLQKRQATAFSGMEKYKIGQIEHPQHGTLDVYNVRGKEIKDDKEYENINANLRKVCSGSSWCVLPQGHGPTHLKHYSHGHGIFFYVNKDGTPVLSHGFGDRGIVRPDNSVIDKEESDDIKKKTSGLLSGTKKEGYDLLSGNPSELPVDRQMKVYEEFGDRHSMAHFLDPNVKTHPELISRIIKDVTTLSDTGRLPHDYHNDRIISHLVKHPSMNESHVEEVHRLYKEAEKKLKDLITNSKYITNPDVSPAEDRNRAGIAYKNHTLHSILSKAVQNRKANKKVIKQLVEDPDHNLKYVAFQTAHHIDDEMIQKGMDDPAGEVRNAASSNYYAMSPKTVEKGLKHADHNVVANTMKSPHVKPEQLKTLIDDVDYDADIDPEIVKMNKKNNFDTLAGRQHEMRLRSVELAPHIKRMLSMTNHVDVIDHALKKESGIFGFGPDIVNNPNVNDDHLKKIMSVFPDTHNIGKIAKAMSKDYDSQHLDELLTSHEPVEISPSGLSTAPKGYIPNQSSEMLQYYARNPHLTETQFNRLNRFSKKNGTGVPNLVVKNLLKNKNVPASIVTDIALETHGPNVGSWRSKEVIRTALAHPKLSVDDIHRGIRQFHGRLNDLTRHGETFIGDIEDTHSDAYYLARNPNLNGQHVTEMLKSPHFNDTAKGQAVDNIKQKNQLTPEHIHQILDLPDLNEQQMKKIGTKYSTNGVKINILMDHGVNLTPEHLEKIKNAANPQTREFYAVRNPNATSDDLMKAIKNTNNYMIAYAAHTHPRATHEHLQAAMSHPDEHISKLSKLQHEYEQKEKQKQQVRESLNISIMKVLFS